MVDRDIQNFNYDIYLAEMAANQSRIISFMDTCVFMENGKLTLEPIYEGAIDTLKALLAKLMKSVRGIWRTFVERINEIFKSNSAYLAKYKDIILNRPPKSRDISMNNYDIKLLGSGLQIPEFNYAIMKPIFDVEDKDASEIQFIKKYFPNFVPDEGETISEKIQEVICGEVEEIDGKSLDLKSMYTFCTNFNKYSAEMQKDIDTINSSESVVQSIINKAASEAAMAAKKKEREAAQAAADKKKKPEANNTDKNDNSTPSVGESAFISVLEKVAIGKSKDPAPSKVTPSNGVEAVDKDIVTGAVGTDTDEDLTNLQNNISGYFSICGNALGAKLKCAESAYKDYMVLIKTHVRDYVKDDE